MAENIVAQAPAAAPAATQETKQVEPTENLDAAEQALENAQAKSVEEKKAEPSKEEPKKDNKRKLKIKVDGTEIEELLDLDDEETLKKHVQLSKVAQKRMQETAQLKKEVGELLNLLKNDPEEALRALGLDVDKLAEGHINKRIEDMQKSPEQLAKEKLEKELEQLRKEKTENEQKTKEAELERFKDKFAMEINEDIITALDKMPDLPKSPYVIKRVADTMLQAMDIGYPNVRASDVIPFVKTQIKKELGDMFGAMPEEILEAVVGKNNIDRLRKRRVAQAKAEVTANSNAQSKTGFVSSNEASKNESKRIPMKDFFKKI